MAYYNQNEREKAILEVQKLLRALSYSDPGIGLVRLSGNYDDDTREAVRHFQEKYGLPVTGIVDHTTYRVLTAVEKAQQEASQLARAVYLLPRGEEYELYPGLRDNVVYVIQHMLEVVSREAAELEGVTLNGAYDEATENAVKAFQRLNLLEMTGVLDDVTFNRLADEYERINSYNE